MVKASVVSLFVVGGGNGVLGLGAEDGGEGELSEGVACDGKA